MLLAASLYFYAAFRASYVLLLLGVTLTAYFGSIAISSSADVRKRRAYLTVSVGATLGALAVFKYFDFFAESAGPLITLPRLDLPLAVGLSFYTFSCVSYVAGVYVGSITPERRFSRFALYISFFPKLLAGPIERSGPFLSQLEVFALEMFSLWCVGGTVLLGCSRTARFDG